MNIYICFRKKSKQVDLKNTIYHYSNIYTNGEKTVEILSSKEISQSEVDSLGKIYFSSEKEAVLQKEYIDLIVDKYIIAPIDVKGK